MCAGMRYKQQMSLLPRLGAMASLAVLCACAPGGPDEPFALYLDRLGRTLQSRAGEPMLPTPVLQPPRTGALRIEIPGGSLDALDFLDLRGCALQVTVGKRNSSLGRLASDSQHLLLELEYLRLAPACVEQQREQGNAQLAQQLHTAWIRKREQLPALIFNATLANREYRQFWRPSPLARSYPDHTSSASVTALEHVTGLARRWLAGNYQADNLEFEVLLSEIAAGDGGTLWRALGHQSAWLAEADRLVERRREAGPLCGPNRRPDAADIVPNVVRRFFVEGIQQRSARLGQRYHALLPPVRALESLLEAALPENYRQWRRARNAALDAYVDAPARHVQHLQALMLSCGGFGGSR